MRIDETAVRERLNRHLEGSRKGEAARIASAAGFSTSTVSRFRSGTYLGDSEKVAARLAKVLAEEDTATAIASGRYRVAWLVRTRTSLRVVRRVETVEHIRQRNQDAHVVQIWLGPEPQDVHFVKQ